MNRGQIDKLEKIIEKQLFENIDNLQKDSKKIDTIVNHLIYLAL